MIFIHLIKMNKANLYRLQQLHEIEKEIHEEKIKHSAIIKNYHCVISFCHVCSLIFLFCMFLLNVGFLSNFQEIIGNISGMVLQGFNLFFGSVSIFLEVIENHLFKKIQKHEKQKTLIEKQISSIRNMVSKALLDDKISESEFEKILFEIEKYRKKVVTYRSIDEANLEFDKMFLRPENKSETLV